MSQDIARDRSIRLFTYLKELSELKTKVVRSIEQYEDVLWLSDIPHERGCFCAAWQTTDEEEPELWVRVKKPVLKVPPKPAEKLAPWISESQIQDSSIEYPELKEQIAIQGKASEDDGHQESQTLNLADYPDIKKLWEEYVEEEWWPWAEEDKRNRRAQQIYTRLFSLYRRQQQLGEAYEIVIGIGFLLWNSDSRYEARRHIVTAQTNLVFHAQKGLIEVRPAAEGAKPILEQDMLDPHDRPAPDHQNALENELKELGDLIWEREKLESVLRGYVNALSSEGQYSGDIKRPDRISEKPVLTFAPAVILRKRTERSLLLVFQEIIKQLKDGADIPLGIRRIIQIADDGRPADAGEHSGDTLPETIYFPLPANDEQKRIAELLEHRQGILVQGPPGTGKSHTIANIVCHLLATGKRVLVTSHTARALRVLRRKFPDEIAGLCVLLLGDDLEAFRSLENSVQKITEKYDQYEKQRQERRIDDLNCKLDGLRRDEARLYKELRAIRERETYVHPQMFGGYEGTAQKIAEVLRNEEERSKWIIDLAAVTLVESGASNLHNEQEGFERIQDGIAEGDEPPLTDGEAMDLLQLLRRFDEDTSTDIRKEIIAQDGIPSPDYFEILVKDESEARKKFAGAALLCQHPSYAAIKQIKGNLKSKLASMLDTLLVSIRRMDQEPKEWTRKAVIDILTGQHRQWVALYNESASCLEELEKRRSVFNLHVEGLGERPLALVKTLADKLLVHLKNGGRLGFWFFRPKVVKDAIFLVKEVKIDGMPCSEIESLSNLVRWLELQEFVKRLEYLWTPFNECRTGTLNVMLAGYKDLHSFLNSILKLGQDVIEIRKMLQELGVMQPSWHVANEVDALRGAIEASSIEEALEMAQSRIDIVVVKKFVAMRRASL